MATSVQIELTSDNGSNEPLIFETLKKSGAIKSLSINSEAYALRRDLTAACSMSAVRGSHYSCNSSCWKQNGSETRSEWE